MKWPCTSLIRIIRIIRYSLASLFLAGIMSAFRFPSGVSMQPVADRIPEYLHVIRVTIPEHYAVRLPKRRVATVGGMVTAPGGSLSILNSVPTTLSTVSTYLN